MKKHCQEKGYLTASHNPLHDLIDPCFPKTPIYRSHKFSRNLFGLNLLLQFGECTPWYVWYVWVDTPELRTSKVSSRLGIPGSGMDNISQSPSSINSLSLGKVAMKRSLCMYQVLEQAGRWPVATSSKLPVDTQKMCLSIRDRTERSTLRRHIC